MLADGLTKGSVDREALVAVCERGVWVIEGDAPVAKELRKEAETDASTTHTRGGDVSPAGAYVVTDAVPEAVSGAVTPLPPPCSAATGGSDAASAEARRGPDASTIGGELSPTSACVGPRLCRRL